MNTYSWDKRTFGCGGWQLIVNEPETSWTRCIIYSHRIYYLYSAPGVVACWGTLDKRQTVEELKSEIMKRVLEADSHMRRLTGIVDPFHPFDMLFDSYIGQVSPHERG